MERDTRDLENSAVDCEDVKSLVPGLVRGLRLLAEFSLTEPVITASEIGRRFAIPRSTVYRLLKTLESSGFLERASRGHDYRLGIAAQHLGFTYLKSLPLTNLGSPLIERLRDRTGSTTHLVMRDTREIVYVARADGQSPMLGEWRVNLGTRLPAHLTTQGHILLGDLSFDELSALYDGMTLQRFPDYTPFSVDELYHQVMMIARRGYGVDKSFFDHGVLSISAPVTCSGRRIIAVISATIAHAQFDDEPMDNGFVEDVVATANELSRQLGSDLTIARENAPQSARGTVCGF
ncbi:IclR family transcriptional regulator [Paraburkholderia caffeinilytica]|uniref:IclR family transcriptional regulator n=1 Tax=Paraburkholderia caffeinilytica TaxID=1761016 RepID=UPI0038B91784